MERPAPQGRDPRLDALVAVAVLSGFALNQHTLTAEQGAVGESGRAARVAGSAFPRQAKEVVLVQSRTMAADDPAFRAAIADLQGRLRHTVAAQNVRQSAVSPDRHSALVAFELPGDEMATHMTVAGPLAAVAAAAKAHPQLVIAESGDASMARGMEESFAQDLHKAESTSMPITLLILVLAFERWWPPASRCCWPSPASARRSGWSGRSATSLGRPDDQQRDPPDRPGGRGGLSLFYLKRVREERAAGRVNGAAIEAAAATSGRAVLVSGFTVMIAMGGMYLGGSPTFSSLATGTILVVAVSVIGSLTVLPAVLSALGDRVEKGRLPLRPPAAAPTGRGLVTDRRAGASPTRPLRGNERRDPGCAGDPGAGNAHLDAGNRVAFARYPGRTQPRPHPGGIPRARARR